MRQLAAAIVLFAICCASAQERDVSLEEPFALRFGESVTVNRDLSVRFAEVEDSRCPRTVQCVWEGNARIRLEVGKDSQRESVLLNTSGRPEHPGEAEVLGHRISLLELVPEPEEPGRIDPRQYIARLRIRRSSG